ncbi:MAG: threonine/serine dehydratase [Rhodospirillaceae bacterium]|nr:threonine/serine dehydratase [Rhodospirillaceae bacterium]
MTVTALDIIECYQKIKSQLWVTPLLFHPTLHNLIQGKVYLKAENLQIGGSFKFRGATHKILKTMQAFPETKKLVAGSSGNHAIAVATIGRITGKEVILIMPEDAPLEKINKVKKQKAEIVFYNRYQEDREAIVKEISGKVGGAIIPPFNDPDVIAGQGTIIPEVFNQLSAIGGGVNPQAILIPCGGGGLVAGCAAAAAHIFPQSQIYAVEPENYNDLERTLNSGEKQKNAMTTPSICDAILTPTVGDIPLTLIRKLSVKSLTVSDEDVLKAVKFACIDMNVVVEPGGVVGLAALMKHANLFFGQQVLIILSGGNIDSQILIKALNM